MQGILMLFVEFFRGVCFGGYCLIDIIYLMFLALVFVPAVIWFYFSRGRVK